MKIHEKKIVPQWFELRLRGLKEGNEKWIMN